MSDVVTGDVVILKPGGPHMTVTDMDSDGEAVCEWFVDGETHRKFFKTAALTKVPVSELPYRILDSVD